MNLENIKTSIKNLPNYQKISTLATTVILIAISTYWFFTNQAPIDQSRLINAIRSNPEIDIMLQYNPEVQKSIIKEISNSKQSVPGKYEFESNEQEILNSILSTIYKKHITPLYKKYYNNASSHALLQFVNYKLDFAKQLAKHPQACNEFIYRPNNLSKYIGSENAKTINNFKTKLWIDLVKNTNLNNSNIATLENKQLAQHLHKIFDDAGYSKKNINSFFNNQEKSDAEQCLDSIKFLAALKQQDQEVAGAVTRQLLFDMFYSL